MSLVVVVAFAGACGGRVDDPSPTPSTSAGSNSPTNTSGSDGCGDTCDYFLACAPAAEDRDPCVRSCNKEFPDQARARAFRRCVEAIPCGEVQLALSMDYGPIGQCYSSTKQTP